MAFQGEKKKFLAYNTPYMHQSIQKIDTMVLGGILLDPPWQAGPITGQLEVVPTNRSQTTDAPC